MNRIGKIILGCWLTMLSWIAITVPIDTYILGGKLKLIWIAVANTTSSSPYSTDGQMNILITIGVITGIIITVRIFYPRLFETDKKL